MARSSIVNAFLNSLGPNNPIQGFPIFSTCSPFFVFDRETDGKYETEKSIPLTFFFAS
jgi:hypothetical protein